MQLKLESAARRIVNLLIEGNDPLFNAYSDLNERRDRQLYELAMELKQSGGKGRLSWPKIPAARLKRIWIDYGKVQSAGVAALDRTGGIVRDEKGMDMIADQMLTLIARLKASTDMMGHSECDAREELAEMYELTFTDQEWDDWMTEYFTDENGAWMLSDYGLPKLIDLYPKIFNADTAEEKLEWVDKALNIVHRRSDLASFFVEGGDKTLTEIFNQGGYTSESIVEDNGPHSYSCVMINLPEDLAERIINWGNHQISDDILYVNEDGGCGRETEIHVTVKYGLTAAQPDSKLLDVFKQTKGFDIRLLPITLFRQKDHDVVKMDIESPYLKALNSKVVEVAEAPGDSHPQYHPHVTLAYVKPGTCDRLEGTSPFDDPVKLGVTSIGKDGVFSAKEVIFSSFEGTKTKYDLGHPALDAVKESVEWSPEDISNLLKNGVNSAE